MSMLRVTSRKSYSPTGNRTLVSRVTGGDTHHYTIEDWHLMICIFGCIYKVETDQKLINPVFLEYFQGNVANLLFGWQILLFLKCTPRAM